MKYIVIVLILFFGFSKVLFAQEDISPTPLPSQNEIPTDSADLEKIQRIKDIVASKVAELNLVEKRGIIGRIAEVSTTQTTIDDLSLKKRLIDIDELTKFESEDNSSDNFGVSDLETGQLYSFVGLYNKDTKRLLARFITKSSDVPSYFEGIVAKTDEDKFQLSVINEDGDEITVDVGRTTKTSSLNETSKLEKSGFSKIQLLERVVVIGFFDLEDKDLLIATRIIHFENIPPSKKMQQYIKLDEENEATDSAEQAESEEDQ